MLSEGDQKNPNPGRIFFQRGTFQLPPGTPSAAFDCDSPEHLLASVQVARAEFVRNASLFSLKKPWKWPIQLFKIGIRYFRLKAAIQIANAILAEQKLMDAARSRAEGDRR